MLQIGNKTIDTMYVGGKLVQQAYIGNKKVYPLHGVIPKAIKDSMVLWYDIGKQQCTNKSMAANPVLADLSGNGHDIECFNFGWSGMSGIGGYNWTYNNFSVKDNFEHTDESVILVNSDKTTFEKLYNMSNSNIVKGQKIKVSGINGNVKIVAYVQASNNKYHPLAANTVVITENGEYDIADLDLTGIENVVYTYQGFKEISIPEGVTVKIENIPLYPNALVSDGVDDNCYTNGLPILTDYTVIAKRSYQGFKQNLQDSNIALAGKNTLGENGAFMLERLLESNDYSEYNFGVYNGITLHNDIITYATKDSYNGVQKLNAGELPDTDTLLLFTKGRYNSTVQAALYSFLLFDRTLTTAEIEWVKQNMIESGGVLKTDWSDSSLWLFYNIKGDKRVEGTLSSNKMVITSCITTNNFMEVIIENAQTPAYNIKVTGLKNGITLQYKDEDTATYLYFNEDGIYTIPAHNTNGRWYGFSFNKTFENENIVIQQLLS